MILSLVYIFLVRDATSRLPNGEGTRLDVNITIDVVFVVTYIFFSALFASPRLSIHSRFCFRNTSKLVKDPFVWLNMR